MAQYVLNEHDRAIVGEMLAWWKANRLGGGSLFRGPLRYATDRRCKGTLASSMSSTDATVDVDNVTTIIGPSPTTDSTSTVEVSNVHGWDADDAAKCRFEWCYSSSQWELYQVDCPA